MSRSKNKIKTAVPSVMTVTAALLIITILTALICGCGTETPGGTDTHHVLTTQSEPAQTDSPPETDDTPPKIVFTPPEDTSLGTYDGYTFTVIEKANTRDSLAAADGDDRHASVKRLVGADIKVNTTADPTSVIQRSAQSGEMICDAMNLPLSDLTVLLRGGYLEDLAGIGLSPTLTGSSRVAAESLAVNGKYYIAFGDISPSSISSVYTLRCNLRAALSNEIYAIFGADIREATLGGELTLERILRVISDSKLIVSSTSCDTVLTIDGDDTVGTAEALITALGGSVFDLGSDTETIAVNDTDFAYAYGKAADIYGITDTDGASVFTITRFQAATDTECSLPLPKLNENADYRCLADTDGTLGWAVPRGIPYGKRTADISAAIFGASYSRSAEYFNTVSNNASDTAASLARLIFDSRAFDAAYIFGWGDLAETVCDGIINGNTLTEIINEQAYAKKAEAARTAIEIFRSRLD